jgi:hypothetical protein
LEGLEHRQLLDAKTRLAANGAEVTDDDLRRILVQLQNNVPAKDRRFSYTDPNGNSVVVTLYGLGTLEGTTVRPDGSLDLVFDNTDNSSRIIGAVKGHTARRASVPLASVRDADSAPRSNAPTGVNEIAALQLPNFRLVDEGHINLLGGVLELNLKSMGRNTSVYLKEGTPPEQAATTDTVITTGGASIGGIEPVTAFDTTAPVSTTSEGIQIRIDDIEAGPLPSPPLGNSQVYTVDPAAAVLLRFDTVTGETTLSVPLPGLSDPQPEVGLAHRGNQLLVLVSDGSTVRAFDAVSGAAAGAFTTSNLAGVGLTEVDGIGSSSTRTLLTSNGGVGVHVDVAASLAAGQAVQLGPTFTPQREFLFNGGAAGAAGSDLLYADGSGHFDTAQPNLFQFGTMSLAPSGLGFREQARVALPGLTSPFQNAGATGLDPSPVFGLGSIDTQLARLAGVVNGRNSILLYTPTPNAIAGSRSLNYAAQLWGLSESVHPEIAGAALLDVQGNVKRVLSKNIQGMVLNATGFVNFVTAHTAIDTAVVGRPINHVEFLRRRNVLLLSTRRGINGKVNRNDVVVNKNLPAIGPLVVPGSTAV